MGDPTKRQLPQPWGLSQRSIRRRAENVLEEDFQSWATPPDNLNVNLANIESSSEPYEERARIPGENLSPDCPASPASTVEATTSALHGASDIQFSEDELTEPLSVELQELSDPDEWYDAEDFGLIRYDCDTCFECRCISCNICVHNDEGECVHCDNCTSDLISETGDDSNGFNSDDSEEDFEEEFVDKEENILNDFINLSLSENLNHKQIEALLKFFRKWSFGKFPLSARTLLKTPISYNIRAVDPGHYWHRGFKKELCEFIQETNCVKVNIKLSCDGLPLARSSGSSFWPILCSFNQSRNAVLAGVYHGVEKPKDPNDYLKDFVEEVKLYCQNGIDHNGLRVEVSLSCVICDAPAKSLILYVKSHNAYFGCTKCTTKGKMYGRRMSYPSLNAELRTDDSFQSQEQALYHKGTTILLEVPGFCPVSSVVLEYLHLVLLGVLRKVLYLWIGGPLRVRLSKRLIEAISKSLISVSSWTPSEFVRKPRSLQYVKRFKGTEFRQILFYVGPVVFINSVRQELYEHFLILHSVFYIFAHPKLSITYLNYANDLVRFWVSKFKSFYGAEYVSHNVHGLIHVAADVKKFGPLDEYSAFAFENFLQILKKLMRKGDKPLPQLIRRFMEAEKFGFFKKCPEKLQLEAPVFSDCHSNGPLCQGTLAPQYSRCKLPLGVSFNCNSDANNCCKMKDGSILLIRNFAYSVQRKCTVVIGRKFMRVEDLYTYPMKSSLIGIHYVYDLYRSLQFWPITDIESKCYRMPFKDGFAVVPLLHNETGL